MARRLAFLPALAGAIAGTAGLLLGALAVSAPAQAQSAACESYRAELASIGRGGDPRAAGAVRQLRGELGRLSAVYSQLGCGRGGFLFFGEPKPPQCGAIEGQLRRVQSDLARAQQASQGNEPRRQQLLAAIDRYCSPGGGSAPAGRQPGFFERLFGGGQPDPQDDPRSLERQMQQQYETNEPREARYGGSRAVCVRTCDGYFFPLPTGNRENAGEMCQALCPSVETVPYFMAGDGTIERAGNREGKPYTELPNASLYKKKFDPACSCRKPGESWATALGHAEELLGKRSGDMIVTAEQAEQLSRPKVTPAKAEPAPRRAAAPKPEPVQDTSADAADADGETVVDLSSVPTASNESSGIAAQSIIEQKTVGANEGSMRETVGVDGQRQNVRVVAPNIFASPTTPTKAR